MSSRCLAVLACVDEYFRKRCERHTLLIFAPCRAKKRDLLPLPFPSPREIASLSTGSNSLGSRAGASLAAAAAATSPSISKSTTHAHATFPCNTKHAAASHAASTTLPTTVRICSFLVFGFFFFFFFFTVPCLALLSCNLVLSCLAFSCRSR